MWNAVSYFENLKNSLKLTKDYTFCRVTGLTYLEDVLAKFTKTISFFGVDDSDDGVTIQKGGAWFNRRAVVVYLLKKYKFQNQENREEILNEIRPIYQKLLTRLIKDSNNMPDLYYWDKRRIPYHEVPGYFAAGTTGIYFIITIEEPIELCYNGDDWE